MTRLANVVLAHPRRVLALFLVLTFGFGVAATRVQIDPSVENMILEDDPDLVYYRGFLERFGSDEFVIIGFTAPGLFDRERLASVQRISDFLANLTLEDDPTASPVIDKVISLSTVVRIDVEGDPESSEESAVSIEPFLPGLPASDEERDALWSRAVSDPLYVGNFLSAPRGGGPEGRLTTLILGRLVIREGDLVYRETVQDRIEEMLDRERLRAAGGSARRDVAAGGGVPFEEAEDPFHLAGVPILKATLGRVARIDLSNLLPMTGALTCGLLFLLFRAASAVLLPLVTVGLTLIWVVGLLTLSGGYVNVVSVVILPLVMVIGVASTIHIFSHYYSNSARFRDPRELLRNTLLTVGWPCFLAAFTTAIGFLSLATSKIGPVREVGLYSAFGVMVAFLISVTLVPMALVRSRSLPSSRAASGWGPLHRSVLRGLATFTDRFRWPVFLGGLAIIGVAVLGIARVRVETDLVGLLERDHELREAYAFIGEEVGGIEPLDVTVRTAPGGLLDPKALARIDRFQVWLEAQPEIDHTFSIVDYLKRVNQAMHDGDPAFFTLPETREQVASALLLLEDSEDTTPFLYPHWENAEEARVLIRRTEQITTVGLLSLIERCRGYLRDHVVTDPAFLYDRAAATSPVTGIRTLDTLYYDARFLLESLTGREVAGPEARPLAEGEIAARVAGVSLLYANMVESLVDGQITSLTLAFGFIWITIMLVLRSAWAGTVAMIPNLFPVVIVLGIMGYVGVTLNIGTAMIGSICIGIAVDDTIHFMSRYRLRLAESRDVRQAVHSTLLEVGRPIVATSIALAIGFAVLQQSAYQPNREFGVLSAVTISVALVGDLVLLPACLHIFKPRIPAPALRPAGGEAELAGAYPSASSG